MRIVHTEASNGWGGQEIRILNETQGMIARGHELFLLCAPHSRIYEEARKRGLHAEALPIGRKSLRGLCAMRRWLKNNPVDVVNTHSSTDSWLTALACTLLPNPPAIVRTRHISAPVNNSLGTRWLYTRATRHIVTTGEKLREQLINDNGYPATQITSVPTGIDTQRFSPGDKIAARAQLGLDPSHHYIGIVATLRSWKGHLHLLEAFAQLHAPDWRLLIVGDGPMRDVIKQRIVDLGLNERVQMAGQQENVETWLQALDIFCLPSYANEGVPQALLQAMLTALPIVTTPVGSITEAVTDAHSALIVPPRQPGQLASALRTLIDDPALATRLGVAAQDVAANNFGLITMLSKMESIFARASQEHPASTMQGR
ncbi:MAG: glycosyltransferase family 1 protein [Burkholderiaceae bacterium]|nr:MAG: glycosyltransferase family 1 protein [Burkholderiaceae bacterium]